MEVLVDHNIILVIGNGFDINLGLKTSYNDFMSWMKEHNYAQDSALFSYLKDKMKLNSWIDIENELKIYSECLSNNDFANLPRREIRIMNENFRKEFYQLCDCLRNYLKIEQVAFRLKKLTGEAIGVLLKNRPLQIISFNYTTFLEYLNIEKINIHYIHGTLNHLGFVFGVEDGANISKEHSFLYKSHSPYLNINHLNERFDDANTILFFGYSLGETDHSYFDDFFKQQSTAGCRRKKFVFYYYGQDACESLYWQLRTLTGKRVAKFKQFNDVQFLNIKK